MPVDTALLYGEMAASWLVHLAVPVGVATLLPTMPFKTKIIIFLVTCAILSLLIQAAFMTGLQASSCAGVKNPARIFKAALLGAFITVGMIAIPLYIEPMRLIVSQLFGSHKSMLTPATSRINDILTTAGVDIVTASTATQVGGALSSEEYEEQTFKEMMIGSAYWAAFAGAYGIGAGSMIASSCT